MSKEQNLIWAEEAIWRVKMIVPAGAGNRIEDIYRSGGRVNQRRINLDRAESARLERDGMNRYTAIETVARASGIGNCGEQAAMAFRHLTHETAAPDVAMIELKGWNHTCVVVGATRLVGADFRTVTIDRAPDLGPEAVICDPWFGMAYDVTHWTANMTATLAQTCWGKQAATLSRMEVLVHSRGG